MSTWHQNRNPVRRDSDTEWNVVDDPPNACMSISGFTTETGAKEYLANRKKLGTDRYLTLWLPRNQRAQS